jgi:hypothetical protein
MDKIIQYTLWLDWNKPILGIAYILKDDTHPIPNNYLPTKEPGTYAIVGNLEQAEHMMNWSKSFAENLQKILPGSYIEKKEIK